MMNRMSLCYNLQLSFFIYEKRIKKNDIGFLKFSNWEIRKSSVLPEVWPDVGIKITLITKRCPKGHKNS